MRTRKGAILTGGILFLLHASPLPAQDWTDLQAVPPRTRIRVIATDGELHGRIEAVEASQLRVTVRGRSIVIARTAILRVEREHRDALWNGMLLGGLTSLALRAVFGDEACSRTPDPRCTIQGVLVGAGLGAIVDYQIRRRRVIYAAPEP